MTEHEYTDVGIRVKYPESGIPRADKLIITYLDAVKNCALAEGERIEGTYELLECEELVSIRLELRICRGRRIMHIGTLGFTANKRSESAYIDVKPKKRAGRAGKSRKVKRRQIPAKGSKPKIACPRMSAYSRN